MHPSALVGLLALAAAASAIPSNPRRAHSSSVSNLKSKIKKIVVLYHQRPGEPDQQWTFLQPYNVTDPSEGHRCTIARDYEDYDIVTDDPSHAVTGNTMEFYSNRTPDNALIADGKLLPNTKGFIHEQIHNYGSSANKSVLAHQVMKYYTENQTPVFTSLVQNYITFND
ncbi:Phosphoesterase [Penicillium argentinense]|uniref:Phosphoesterase n=1 Tax=Penicillium argentinense TaxID=1131581 RepID=A0A9W9G5T0_9EURO|nr:Phosphoesterase [Penicillium argentinense]KAJ5112504.1 Phosphoesterase [Penicillium argentinense]